LIYNCSSSILAIIEFICLHNLQYAFILILDKNNKLKFIKQKNLNLLLEDSKNN